MKTLGIKLLLGNLGMMALLGLLAGCASPGYQKAGATSEALQVAANRITNGILQIDVTLTALTNLVNNPQGDLAPRYKKYCDDVANLRSVAVDVNNKAIAMQGLQASGLHAALLLEGTLGALVHSSHNEDRQRLFEAQRTGGLKAYLEVRDGPFLPEPMGPKSKPRAAKA